MKKFLCFFAIAFGLLCAVSCNKDDKPDKKDTYVWDGVTPMPEAVDLGLESGLKWASFNIGASAPEVYGDYFAWGETETETKDDYSWATYKWCNGRADLLTKYCPLDKSEYMNVGTTPDEKTVLESDDDVAQVKLGGNWRMPTEDEWTELMSQCTWMWITLHGINGYKVTSNTNGNSIFLPAAGIRYDTDFNEDCGRYWSSSLMTNSPCNARAGSFDSSDVKGGGFFRCVGLSIRPVTD